MKLCVVTIQKVDLRKWVKGQLGRYCKQVKMRTMAHDPKCGRSGGEKRKKYPKCVPIAKARAMSKGQRAGAVRRKQAKANTGPTPSRAATFAKKKRRHNGKRIKKSS